MTEKETQNQPGLFPEELQRNTEKPFSTDEVVEHRFSIDHSAPPPLSDQPVKDTTGQNPRVYILGSAIAFFLIAVFVVSMGGYIAKFLNNGVHPSASYTPPADQGLPLLEQPNLEESSDTASISAAQIAYLVSPSIVGVCGYNTGNPAPIYAASGMVVNDGGYLATYYPTALQADIISVTLSDGTSYLANTVAVDEASGLCLLRIDVGNLVLPTFAVGNATATGERAVVLTNPGGTGFLVAEGIVSSVETPLSLNCDTALSSYLQLSSFTGAAGGAVVNRYGYVVGICANGEGGLWNAIPISTAKPVIDTLLATGAPPERAFLGVSVQAIGAGAAAAAGLPENGLYITEITPKSPLLAHGITVGAVLLEAAGRPLTTPADLVDILAAHKPGGRMALVVYLPTTGRQASFTCILAGEGTFLFNSEELAAMREAD